MRGLHLLLLVVWLGGAVTLFAAVAPAAFTHLPNTKLSGLIVGHVIGFLDWLALCAWPYLATTAWLDERARGNPTSQWVRVSALTVMSSPSARAPYPTRWWRCWKRERWTGSGPSLPRPIRTRAVTRPMP